MDTKEFDMFKDYRKACINADFARWQERVEITLLSGKVINIRATEEEMASYKVVLDTYTLGDYVFDADRKILILSVEELTELIKLGQTVGKNKWKYRNTLLGRITEAKTEEEVYAVVWED